MDIGICAASHISDIDYIVRAGLNQVMLLPSFDPGFEVIEGVAKDILPTK